ncbi:cation efflux family protein [Legionella lansingensis]|uniref:Cation efflux family protein n=1 Tax=Legionella lansingensis TaxID=45067 RepID=A0A0W0VUB0_9GAMM|nr:cation diffusion facilitator family transporter [Legionella lansingensis]KTD23783.1 cation efflux family protein [Legionella lansingensis]SNV47316.1 cation efflux family protein [Legionella lansingensis]
MTQQDRYSQAKKITIIGAVVTAILGVIKLFGGIIYHSHALVADGVHSFSDLITDLMVLFASKYGSQDADATHPYGHQRIETAATLILALLLILAGAGIAWDSLSEVIQATHDKPGWLALPVALLSIVANEMLFHYTYHVGQKIQSSLVITNAWHHRSDAASSIVVTLGLVGTILGFIYLDAIAAIIVGLMIIKMGMSYGWDSVKELIDTAVEPEVLKKIEDIIESVPGVEKIHQLRSRLMGGDILVDVHILVSPYISVSEGHYIAQHVHQALMNELKRVKDVIVHVDPEDDELTCPSLHLPNRVILQEELLSEWQQDFPGLVNWTIHYLDGKMTIDLIFTPKKELPPSFYQRIYQDLDSCDYPLEIRVFFQQDMTDDEKN